MDHSLHDRRFAQLVAGEKGACAPQWIATVDWKNSVVYVNLSRETIKSGPEFDPDKLDRDYEAELYKHYGQQNY
jgi:hypothetical protein